MMAQAQCMLLSLLLALVLLSTCSINGGGVAAMRVPTQAAQKIATTTPDAALVEEHQQHAKNDLNTYFFSASDVRVNVLGKGGRPGTTRVQLTLQERQVSAAMPVVTVAASGIVHNVVDTWRFLKNFALQTRLVNKAFNAEAAAGSTRRFPIPAASLQASSALTKSSAASTVEQELMQRPQDCWSRDVPTNVLLLPDGHATGAVADVMSVDMRDDGPDGKSGPTAVSLTLDVVHAPRMVSELQEHPPQSLDAAAHYHFFLPAGVAVDAEKFLALLASSAGALTGLHIFAKGDKGCTDGEVCRPAAGFCDLAEVCTGDECPPDAKKHHGARCPWFPSSHGKYGRYSIDVSSMRQAKVSGEEAIARLSSAPSYLREAGNWPRCEGTCILGACALKWSHPACCRVGGHGEHEAAATSDDGHFEGDHYCWGY